MNTNWRLNTHGDPLGRLQTFAQAVWEQAGLDAMVVPADGHEQVLRAPGELSSVNPFLPLMKENVARRVAQALDRQPQSRFGAILRPCEMRSLSEMAARGALDPRNLLAICVDCLGTFPVEEYEWRAARKGAGKRLSRDALKFAPQGGIVAYRYRSICQICASPGATDGDLNIGVLGLPVRQTVLVHARGKAPKLDAITDDRAEPALVDKREQMIAKISERHTRTRERVIQGLQEVLPKDLDALLDQFQACAGCQTCMDVCPICSVEYPRRAKNGRLVREDVVNWLVSCAGCGMCEQACPGNKPLNIIFAHIKSQLEKELSP